MDGLITIGKVVNCRKIHPHSHSIWEMAYYTGGKATLTLGGRSYDVEPYTLVCQPAGMIHGEEGQPEFDNFYFKVESYHVLPERQLILRDTMGHAILNEIRQMYDCYFSQMENYKNICQAHLNTICQYVLGQISSGKKMNPYVEKLSYLISEQASDCDFTVERAYDKLPYSADYLRVIFRQEFGCSPGQYLMRTRIHMAKELLNKKFYDQALSVKTIAEMCGFRDPLYFSRCFKKATGLSPLNYLERPDCPDS